MGEMQEKEQRKERTIKNEKRRKWKRTGKSHETNPRYHATPPIPQTTGFIYGLGK